MCPHRNNTIGGTAYLMILTYSQIIVLQWGDNNVCVCFVFPFLFCFLFWVAFFLNMWLSTTKSRVLWFCIQDDSYSESINSLWPSYAIWSTLVRREAMTWINAVNCTIANKIQWKLYSIQTFSHEMLMKTHLWNGSHFVQATLCLVGR